MDGGRYLGGGGAGNAERRHKISRHMSPSEKEDAQQQDLTHKFFKMGTCLRNGFQVRIGPLEINMGAYLFRLRFAHIVIAIYIYIYTLGAEKCEKLANKQQWLGKALRPIGTASIVGPCLQDPSFQL